MGTRRGVAFLVPAVIAVWWFSPQLVVGQEPGTPSQRGMVTISALDLPTLRVWDENLRQLLARGDLAIRDVRPDATIEGREVESFVQYYRGIPVYGGSLTRQTERGVTLSVIGTLRTGVDLDPTPALSAEQAAAAMRDASGGTPMTAEMPRLVILPLLDDRYALAYEATMSDAKTYFVDAKSGAILWSVNVFRSQGSVGRGTGVLGDVKKLSTTQAAGSFRTHDQLRPAAVRTYTTRGSDAVLDRLLRGRQAFDSDFPVGAGNEWSNQPGVVDAHVNTGWTEDYLYKQFNWTGVNNSNTGITTIVDSTSFSLNNASAVPPPFGPGGSGAFVFGQTSRGVPITSLDTVAHEVMHNVTHASVAGRTGSGLFDALYIDRLGPTSVSNQGSTFACSSTTIGGSPTFCINGQYVLASNHPGAINEAFSDVAGTGAEFFFEAPGNGPLRAEYRMGEDVSGFGPIRALDVPRSISVPTSSGPIPFPDHATGIFSYIVIITNGTRQNPLGFDLAPFIIVDGAAVQTPIDDGAVHINATVLGHAFYLAVEGGQNVTSGQAVQGVGGANRAQIERAFFRAMTVYMPNVPRMTIAALATYQSAVDLYGAQSPAARAIDQAMRAVGLR